MSVWDQSMIVAAASTGAIIGQVSFGMAADYLGRRVTFLTSCVLLIVGAWPARASCSAWESARST